ncbi:hypothetical protein EVJ58_g3381 [Rhodofomes roseus]|uniref:C2H2-type domain-containing protein n=1 Tax=Rhodofomes roseus TaxID=34475 RepID=A0A4Y9YKW9_9APHY|nr:hypothetical protein EVJ58_g3381 [Rhodofomes roseus]
MTSLPLPDFLSPPPGYAPPSGGVPPPSAFALPPSYGMAGDHDPAAMAHKNMYGGGEQGNEQLWAYQERPAQGDLYNGGSYHSQESFPSAEDANSLLNRYLKQEPPVISLDDLSSNYFPADVADPALASYHTLHGQGHDSMTADFGYGFDHPAQPQSYDGGSPSFTLTSDPNLQYPPPSESVPRFVSPAQISPGMSPAAPLHTVDNNETAGLDPRYTVGSPPALHPGSASSSSLSSQESFLSQAPYPLASPVIEQTVDLPEIGRPSKRRRAVSFTSSSSSEQYQDGESERETDDGMDDDDEYVEDGVSRLRTRLRTVSSASSSSRSDLPARRMAPPVPVPNLTKKSRGRRVPTASSVLTEDLVEKGRRGYMCEVDGCGKCFARGEHLKRHVRSIHTNEKPHKCPFPGCGKDFSRHDNLGQHMRVHKNWPSKQRRLAGPA